MLFCPSFPNLPLWLLHSDPTTHPPPPSYAGTAYWVLSGQHLSKAISNLKTRYEIEGYEPSEYMKTVDAEVLLYTTPLEQRQIYAGERQFAQQAVDKIKQSSLIYLAIPTPDRPADPVQRLVGAVAKAGFPRIHNKVRRERVTMAVACVHPRRFVRGVSLPPGCASWYRAVHRG